MSILETLVRKAMTTPTQARRAKLRMESDEILVAMTELDQRMSELEHERDRAVFQYDRLLNFLPAILCVKLLDGTLLQVNKYTADGLGLKPEDMIGRNQREFWPEDQCDNFEADDKIICASGEGKYGYLEPVQYDGTPHTFRTWKVPIWNGATDPVGVMLFAVDLTVFCDMQTDVLGVQNDLRLDASCDE